MDVGLLLVPYQLYYSTKTLLIFVCLIAGDGRLTLAEMGAALKRVGARLSLSQVTALFRHFGRGRLGLDEVDRR